MNARVNSKARLPIDNLGLLAAATVVLSWIAEIAIAESAVGGLIDLTTPKSTLYYICHAGSILLGLLTGFLALANGAARFLGLSARLAMAVMFLTAVIWAGVAYTPRQILSPVILGATGPFIWLILIFAAAGLLPEVNRAVEKVIPWLALFTAAFAARMLIVAPIPAYSAGFSIQTAYALLMLWLGGWTLISSARMNGLALLFRLVPYLVMFPVAIASQSRSWTILTLLLGAVWTFLRIGHQGWLRSALMLTVLALGGIFAIGRLASSASDTGSAIGKLADRLGEDTRSGQYIDFFADVKPGELLLGRGPTGTWYWTDVGEYQFIDNGFLWMLFLGGVPLLVSYLILQVWPALPLLRHVVGYVRQGDVADAASICMLIFWGLALAGLSTFNGPSLSLVSFITSIWAGRCHRLRWERAMLTQPSRPITDLHHSAASRPDWEPATEN